MSQASPEVPPAGAAESVVPPPEPGAAPAADDDIADYVRSAARLLRLPLGAAQAGRVASHLARTRALAAVLQALELTEEVEPAEIFSPAPFPAEDAA